LTLLASKSLLPAAVDDEVDWFVWLPSKLTLSSAADDDDAIELRFDTSPP
jgi:hypothetical protein